MTERERVLRDREVYAKGLLRGNRGIGPYSDDELASAKRVSAAEFPLPTRTVPTVRQGLLTLVGVEPCWYRVFERGDAMFTWRYVERYYTRADALARTKGKELGGGWPPEDQPVVAALLLLPLTEEIEDTE